MAIRDNNEGSLSSVANTPWVMVVPRQDIPPYKGMGHQNYKKGIVIKQVLGERGPGE